VIPPGEADYAAQARMVVQDDARIVALNPHMHLRGKSFEYLRMRADGQPEVLLQVKNYRFDWQLSYRLAQPVKLEKGTRLECVGHFDNSAANPRNPDAKADVGYGQQSWEEMMIGFFDVAVDAKVDKKAFFVR
jgi:hypothetical protein